MFIFTLWNKSIFHALSYNLFSPILFEDYFSPISYVITEVLQALRKSYHQSYTAKLMHYYLMLFQEEQGNANAVCVGSRIKEQRNRHSKFIKILLVLLVYSHLNQEENAFRSELFLFLNTNFHKCMLYSAVVILKFSQYP